MPTECPKLSTLFELYSNLCQTPVCGSGTCHPGGASFRSKELPPSLLRSYGVTSQLGSPSRRSLGEDGASLLNEFDINRKVERKLSRRSSPLMA
jgi:hypothetical protein